MTDDRIDFTPLDPTRDPERFERIVQDVMAEAEDLLAARRAEHGVIGQVAGWWKPLLAAAAAVAVVSAATLRLAPADTRSETEFGIAEAIGVPTSVADWLETDEAPTAAELLFALEDS